MFTVRVKVRARAKEWNYFFLLAWFSWFFHTCHIHFDMKFYLHNESHCGISVAPGPKISPDLNFSDRPFLSSSEASSERTVQQIQLTNVLSYYVASHLTSYPLGCSNKLTNNSRGYPLMIFVTTVDRENFTVKILWPLQKFNKQVRGSNET